MIREMYPSEKTEPLSSTLETGELSRLIDHTLLRPDATCHEIEQLCREAMQYGFAAVCVNPCRVAEVARLLKGTPVAVCTVVGFPLGANTAAVKRIEAAQAIECGATEVDMVINVGALKDGDDQLVERDIAGVVSVVHQAGALCKVILETALLSDQEKVRGCRLAQHAGADFVKTSTGFSRGGATAEDVALMRETVGATMGVKAAGGIRTTADALRMVAAGANRIGASASVEIVQNR